MNSVPEMGSHLILDFHNTKVDLNNYEFLNENFRRIIIGSGATIETSNYKQFDPQGLSILYLLSESHFSIHTWPEHGACAIDFYHCGSNARLRMMKAEELLCEFLGWENCTGSMIIDRGTYHYSLIQKDEHTSILYKKHKLVERQRSSVGCENRLYLNEKHGSILSIDGNNIQSFKDSKGLNEVFDEELSNNTTRTSSPIKENSAQDENANSSSNCQGKKHNLLVIGCGDLTLPQEILLQGYCDEVTVYDPTSGCEDRVDFLKDNSKDLLKLFKEGKLTFTSDEFKLEPASFTGVVILNRNIQIKDAKYYSSEEGYLAVLVQEKEEFKEICSKEAIKRYTIHTISNTINRFLIGKGRFS